MALRIRFPIAAQMALWLLLNLALLVGAGWWLFRSQFRGGFDSFLATAAAPRVEALAEDVTISLKSTKTAQWTEALSNLSAVHRVPIAVYENGGDWVAGPKYELPQKVLNLLGAPTYNNNPPHPGAPGAPGGGPPGAGPPGGGPPGGGPPGGRPPFDRQPPGGRRDLAEPPGFMPRPAGPIERQLWPKFLVTTSQPTAYWVGIRAPVGTRAMAPMTILIRCDSIGTGGLLLETRPILFAAIGCLVISILFWLPIAFGMTRHLRRITDATAEVARGNFDVRLPGHTRDELGELALSINAMAGQLDHLVRGQKRFLGDVAHELCSPLARMQAALGILENQASDEKQMRYVGMLAEELDDMSRLVDELLNFSRATAQRELQLKPVPLAPLIAETVAREAPDAEVECDVPAGLTAKAEPRLLARAIGNVLRNAVRYAGNAGPIVISASPQGDRINLVVADSGPGVPIESLPRLFDAFYRPDVARTRETGGSGLGLAIVKTCIEACRGTVEARLGEPHGLEVCFSLPVAG